MAVLALWMTGTVAVPGSNVEGAKPREWPANPDRHRVTIRRTAANESEKKMISVAEAAYPAKSEVVAAGKMEPPPVDDKLWWYKEVLGIKIPYAITARTIEYYSGLMEGYRKKALTRYAEPSSRFSYEASISVQETYAQGGKTFSHVYVVKMKLFFEESFVASQSEAVHFNKDREVILDTHGQVLQVTGDGETQVPMLAM